MVNTFFAENDGKIGNFKKWQIFFGTQKWKKLCDDIVFLGLYCSCILQNGIMFMIVMIYVTRKDQKLVVNSRRIRRAGDLIGPRLGVRPWR